MAAFKGGKAFQTCLLVAAAGLAGFAIIRAHSTSTAPAPAVATSTGAAAPASQPAARIAASTLAQPTAPPAAQPAVQPPAQASSKPLTAAQVNLLEVSANDAFNNGQYALALPMYRKVIESVKNQPDRQGMLQERVRVCEQACQGGEGGSVPANMAKLVLASATQPASPTAPLNGPTTAPVNSASAAVASAAPIGGTSQFDPSINFPMAPEARKPHPAPQAGQVIEMPIKELGNFEYDPEKGGGIPADVVALTGHIFRTHGYMMPLDQADNITEFALVPSLFNCCMGQPPQIQHTIVVHCPKGKAVSYFPDEIIVEGTLKVEEKKDDGYVVSLFEMEARSVKPAPQ